MPHTLKSRELTRSHDDIKPRRAITGRIDGILGRPTPTRPPAWKWNTKSMFVSRTSLMRPFEMLHSKPIRIHWIGRGGDRPQNRGDTLNELLRCCAGGQADYQLGRRVCDNYIKLDFMFSNMVSVGRDKSSVASFWETVTMTGLWGFDDRMISGWCWKRYWRQYWLNFIILAKFYWKDFQELYNFFKVKLKLPSNQLIWKNNQLSPFYEFFF